MLPLEVLMLLLETPSDDGVEVAVDFVKEVRAAGCVRVCTGARVCVCCAVRVRARARVRACVCVCVCVDFVKGVCAVGGAGGAASLLLLLLQQCCCCCRQCCCCCCCQ